MYTLFGIKGSGSAAVESALELAGQPYRLVTAASWESGSDIAQLERVNPLKQIPTLVLPDGTVLTESAAILIHLGLAHPASGLLPADAKARALALRGLVYIAANCYSAISISDYPERWLADASEAAKDNLRAGTRQRLYAHWDIFADTFALSPAQPGGLELLAAVVSRWSGARKHLQQSRPACAAALAAVEANEGVRPVFARHWS
jgi:GST-like protein